MPTPPQTGTAKMRPRAKLVSLIGEELISDEPVALVELVKNAYDADATEVRIIFARGRHGQLDSIVVEDDGIGMDLDTVLTAWLEPGTDSKRGRERSPGGRPYQGAKGIGRFAAARLAESLLLESMPAGGAEGVLVLLDWGRFDDSSYLDEIEIEYQVVPPLDFAQGVRLTLDGLRKTWTDDDFERLHARLTRLISPFRDVSDFKVVLAIPGRDPLSGEVEPPELLVQPKYQLVGELDPTGSFTGRLEVDGHTHKEFAAVKLGAAGSTPACGPFEVELRSWDRDREGLLPLTERLGLSSQEIRRTLNTYCGVSIYRDGFRVHPYGETGNDWLGLDLRSRLTPGQKLANNQIIGAIRITREGNLGLRDRSDREGMVVNPEFRSLQMWFVEVLSLLESERYGLRPRRDTHEDAGPLFEAFDLSATLRETARELGPGHAVTSLITEAEQRVREGAEKVHEVFSRLLMSAGLGHMVDMVIHEIGAPLGKANIHLATLKETLADVLDGAELARVQPILSALAGCLEDIHNLRSRLEPQTPAKRGRATVFDLLDEIRLNFQLFEALLANQGIVHEVISPEPTLSVKMSQACLGQILANLIDNSIFWLARGRGTGNGGRIQLAVALLEHGFRITFQDDGPGVAEGDRGRVFDPYFTHKPNGMGLGLYIARLVIEPYGRLVCSPSSSLGGACFEATFERRVGR